jgi:uncharacterized membrane protein YfcA
MDWTYTLSGLVVGFIVGLTGVGGGSLMTPLLVLFFGIPPATAVGTDLLYASITKTGGIWVHGRRGNIDWRIVGWMALGSVPAAILTTWALAVFRLKDQQFSALISSVLGVALILTALAIFFRERVRRASRDRAESGLSPSPQRLALASVATGVVLGLLVTISSVGAGAIGMVALLWLYPRLPSVKRVGIDIAHAVPLTAVAGLGHFYLGTVDFTLLGSLLLGSLPGIYLGSHASGLFPERVMRPTLACMLMLIGARLVF